MTYTRNCKPCHRQRENMSPYGQRVFAGTVQGVNLCYNAMMSKTENGKMRVFLSNVMFDVGRDGRGAGSRFPAARRTARCSGRYEHRGHNTRVRAGAEDGDQARTFRVALQTLGDPCWFELDYFDLDRAGYLHTATEVSADNSVPMRNNHWHEHTLEGAITGICRTLLAMERHLRVELPNEELVRTTFDNSPITDTATGKRQNMDDVASGLMRPREYRCMWYGEDEATARRLAVSDTDGVALERTSGARGMDSAGVLLGA